MRNNKPYIEWFKILRESMMLLTCAQENIITSMKIIDCVASKHASNGYNPNDLYKLHNDIKNVCMNILNYKIIVEGKEQKAYDKHISRRAKCNNYKQPNTKNNPF